MQFRLTYEGPLLATTPGNSRAKHKHEIRKKFHPQLKRLWASHPLLKNRKTDGPGVTPEPMVEHLAKQFAVGKYNFVPLVTRQLRVLCGLHVLFLRPEPPGEVINSGDIDNRLKTLFDALNNPDANQVASNDDPNGDEQPFYTLLEDDKLVSSISVDTDLLLEAVDGCLDANTARLLITVTIKPYVATWSNIGF